MSTQVFKKKKLVIALGMTASLGLVGCVEDGSDGVNSLSSITDLAAGDECRNGGKQIQLGLDTNGNNALDSDEVTQTTNVCHGDTGATGDTGEDGEEGVSSLIVTNNVAADDLNCEFGGLLIRAGLDSNRNSLLDTDEIDNENYICNADAAGAIPAIISSLTASPTTVLVSESTTLTVTPTDPSDQNLTYVWRDADGVVQASTSDTLKVDAGTTTGDFTYSVEVTNGEGVVQERAVTITVAEQIQVTQVSSVSTTSRQVFLPQGFTVSNDTPSGDFDGTVVNAGQSSVSPSGFRSLRSSNNTQNDVAGFISERPAFSAGTDSASVIQSLANTVNMESDISLSNVSTTSPNLAEDVTSAIYRISLSNALTPTELNNRLIVLLGANKIGGIIQDLPQVLSGDIPATEFQLNMSVTYFNNSSILLTATVVSVDNLVTYQTQVNALNDGSNVAENGATKEVAVDNFTALASTSSLADFLFVIDNSGSMSDEQTAISQAATDFSSVMSSSGLDYQIATITTDSATLRGNGFTSDLNQFQNDVVAGTGGSYTETGIYYSEQALLSSANGDAGDGTVTAAGYPRAGASLSVVLLSDEPSQYTSRGSAVFDVSNNLFVDRDIRFYSIVDQSDAGQYIELSTSTFGAHASISNLSAFPTIMSLIASNAGAAASIYELTQKPLGSTIKVHVDGVEVLEDALNGWAYNSTSNRILFSGSSIPSEGANVEIAYEYTSNSGS